MSNESETNILSEKEIEELRAIAREFDQKLDDAHVGKYREQDHVFLASH